MSPSSLQLTHPRVCVCVGELHSTQGSIKRHTHTCLVSSWVLPFALSGGAHIPHSAESQCEAGVMSPSILLLGDAAPTAQLTTDTKRLGWRLCVVEQLLCTGLHVVGVLRPWLR
jgi:hypothetical protein